MADGEVKGVGIPGCITSANCSPTAIIKTSFQNCSACALGTRKVQEPPFTFLGSSHTGFTPLLKKWTESFSCSRSRGKELRTSQKGFAVIISSFMRVSLPS